MSKENIKVVLEKRANDILEREKQVAEEAKEQERVRLLCYIFCVFNCSFKINNKTLNFKHFSFYWFFFNYWLYQEIKYDLARNGKQTKEQKLVISKFPKEITYDEEHLLSMSKENIKVVLEKRFSLCSKASLSLRIFSRSILSCSCF
jgi:hypothetical protein